MLAPVDEARALYARARAAKALQARARREAQDAMERCRRLCEKYGIEFNLVTVDGDESHGQTAPQHLDPRT